jgi:glycosyltransferase involved in cell wall biosynthesis
VHVGLIAPPWIPVPPPAYGGTEAVLDVLARGLVAAGHRVTLVTTSDSTCPVERSAVLATAPGVGCGGTDVELRHVAHAYEVTAAADVVHDHTLIGPLWPGRRDGQPVITTNHGPFDEVLLPLYRHVSRGTAVVAISHHHAQSAAGVAVAAVIHHAVDTAAIRPGRGDGGYAAFLGRMHPQKGVHVAIEVARHAGVPLRLAAKMSEPFEREYFRAVVAPLLGDGIEYVGELGGEDKTALLGGATCLLDPVEWPEPFGMVVVESLACGTPVVATTRGALPELVDHGRTGFLADTVADLAAAVLAAGDLDRGACRAVAEQRFSPARLATDHVALYEALLGRRGGGDTPLRAA